MEYELKRSFRARSMRIVISSDGSVRVHVPMLAPPFLINSFLSAKRDWIEATRAKMHKRRVGKKILELPRGAYGKHKEEARVFIESKLLYWNQHFQFSYKNISIRNQKSRWGSCSARGNLSFNYKLLFLPEHLADYVVVHELVHLAELNHSPRFWKLVGGTFPDYKKRRRELRTIIFSTPKKGKLCHTSPALSRSMAT